MVLFETERLIIREYNHQDIDKLHVILSNNETMKFWPNPFVLFQTEIWLQRNIDSYEKNGYGRCGIILKKNEELIGDCGIMLTEVDGELRNDLGYIIHCNHWGKGYAVEAGRACIEYGLENLN